MNIHICDLCTGRHLTSACVIGRDAITQCFATPILFVEPVAAPTETVLIDGSNVIPMFTDRHNHLRRAWPTDLRNRGRGSEGIRVERLG